MTQGPQPGQWYQANDGNWYCWPDPTPHSGPPWAEGNADTGPAETAPVTPAPAAVVPTGDAIIPTPTLNVPWMQPGAPNPFTDVGGRTPSEPATSAFAEPAATAEMPAWQPTPAAPYPGGATFLPGGPDSSFDAAPFDTPARTRRSGGNVPVLLAILGVLVILWAIYWFVIRDDDLTTTPAVRPTVIATTAAPNTSSADRAKAAALVVTTTDVPAGWHGSKRTATPGELAIGKQFARCSGAADPTTDYTALVLGDDFVDGTGLGVSSEGGYLRDHRTAARDVAAITGPGYVACAKTAFATLLSQTSGGGSVSALNVTAKPIAKYGDTAKRYSVTATVETNGTKVAAYVEQVYLVKGRAELSVTFISTGKPFPEDVLRAVMAKAGLRFLQRA